MLHNPLRSLTVARGSVRVSRGTSPAAVRMATRDIAEITVLVMPIASAETWRVHVIQNT